MQKDRWTSFILAGPAAWLCSHFSSAARPFGIASRWSCCAISWRANTVLCHPNGRTFPVSVAGRTYSMFTNREFALSEDPKDLIRKCLVVDPEKRINVRDCLKHPFFNTVVSSPSHPGRNFLFTRTFTNDKLHLKASYRPSHTIFRLINLLVFFPHSKFHTNRRKPFLVLSEKF